MDTDLRSIQEARMLLRQAAEAQQTYRNFSQDAVDQIVTAMAKAGEKASEILAKHAHEETGFGRIESKIQKNLFATKTLHLRMQGMKTCGIIRKLEDDSIWEIATPMGVIAALIPSTNPTSTAMYKAIIAAKARCALVVSPHPRAVTCTDEALRVVADAAYKAGAPEGLFGCMTQVTIDGTNALLEDRTTDLILATGGSAMVRAAYSKGKPALGVGSGNVPVYVDRTADLEKAAQDIVYGASFDYGTLCSTERSVVTDLPIRGKLLEQLRKAGAHVLNESEKELLRVYVWKNGRLNADQVGKSPAEIARNAGFSVPPKTAALVAEVERVGKEEPLSVETLSPILSFYTTDGWEAGCKRCKEILAYGGIGHTLGIHATNERIIEAFALEKPAMRIIVNSVCALGAVGYTNRLFPAMTLGPGAVGGSITSDNISPLHLINIKRVAFETAPIHPSGVRNTMIKRDKSDSKGPVREFPPKGSTEPTPWMSEIDARLRARAGNPPSDHSRKRTAGVMKSPEHTPSGTTGRTRTGGANKGIVRTDDTTVTSQAPPETKPGPLSDDRIEELIKKFRRT